VDAVSLKTCSEGLLLQGEQSVVSFGLYSIWKKEREFDVYMNKVVNSL